MNKISNYINLELNHLKLYKNTKILNYKEFFSFLHLNELIIINLRFY